jgi:hypothetical protein
MKRSEQPEISHPTILITLFVDYKRVSHYHIYCIHSVHGVAMFPSSTSLLFYGLFYNCQYLDFTVSKDTVTDELKENGRTRSYPD